MPSLTASLRLKPLREPPSFQDWLLVAINVVFVALGIVMLRRDPYAGIVTIAFFGSCLAVAASVVVRKQRYLKFRAEKVQVAGGVPIRPKKSKLLFVSSWLALLGLILVVFGHEYPSLFRLLGALVGFSGTGMLLATLAGKLPGGHLQFDPDALTIAERRWVARIPWQEIVTVYESDFQSNPVLLISVADTTRLDVSPPEARPQALNTMARNYAMTGADFSIMTAHYGIDLPVLAATVARYVGDADARAELRPRLHAGHTSEMRGKSR